MVDTHIAKVSGARTFIKTITKQNATLTPIKNLHGPQSCCFCFFNSSTVGSFSCSPKSKVYKFIGILSSFTVVHLHI